MSKIIEGQAFDLSTPYAAGHVINEAEAKTLNQTRSENIGNIVRPKLKELLPAGKLDEARALVAEVDAKYVFTLSGAGASAPKLDPVEKAARRLAKTALIDLLAKTGRKIGVTPEGETEETWAAKVEGELNRIASLDIFLDEAKKEVKAAEKRKNMLAAAI